MPYVPQKDRERLNPLIDKLYGEIHTKGELNYCITRLLAMRLRSRIADTPKQKLSYDVASETHGVAEDVAKEFYRRLVAPYEDRKCEENGDVDIIQEVIVDNLAV